jgi:hypothetical protein
VSRTIAGEFMIVPVDAPLHGKGDFEGRSTVSTSAIRTRIDSSRPSAWTTATGSVVLHIAPEVSACAWFAYVIRTLWRALIGATYAGGRVFDSMAESIDDEAFKGLKAIILVSTDEESVDIEQDDYIGGAREIVVVIEMPLACTLTVKEEKKPRIPAKAARLRARDRSALHLTLGASARRH